MEGSGVHLPQSLDTGQVAFLCSRVTLEGSVQVTRGAVPSQQRYRTTVWRAQGQNLVQSWRRARPGGS